ncbi:hypothetical protein [Streptomyces sp. NPDC001978]|uniref:hypothetical protein n=1 Tax=Streptomyces sp. NPDC001978 TaxID=3364627 RepID=UPI00367BF2CE
MRRILRRVGTGAAATALIHAALLGVTAGDESYVDLGWTGTAPVLARIHAVAPWPLMALTLLWLAHRHHAVYVRGAIALLLSGAAGLAASVSLRGLPVHKGLVRDCLALPGVLTGWYVLMTLAVVACISAIRARIAVMVIALSAVAVAVLTADHHVLGAVWAAGVPLTAWYAAGRIQRQGARSRGLRTPGNRRGMRFRSGLVPRCRNNEPPPIPYRCGRRSDGHARRWPDRGGRMVVVCARLRRDGRRDRRFHRSAGPR